MPENVTLQVAGVGCYILTRSQQLAVFLTRLIGRAWGERALWNEKTRSVRMRAC